MSSYWVDFHHGCLSDNVKLLSRALSNIKQHEKNLDIKKIVDAAVESIDKHLIIEEILKHYPELVSYDNNLLLRTCSFKNAVDTAKMLLQRPEIDLSNPSLYLVFICGKGKSLEIIRMLFEDERVKVEECSEICLYMAINLSTLEVVKYIYNSKRYDLKSCNIKRCLYIDKRENIEWLMVQPEVYKMLVGDEESSEAESTSNNEESSSDSEETNESNSSDETSSNEDIYEAIGVDKNILKLINSFANKKIG